jgi:hypothetical protein
MREEQEQAEPADAGDEADDAPEPFDQNPPVNPSEPQVGNSRAQFFMPREEGEEDDEQPDEEEEVREGDA